MAAKKTVKINKGKQSTNFVRRVHAVIMEDVTASVMIASLILNLFFLVAIVLYHTSGSFELKVYRYTRSHFCDDRREVIAQKDYDLACATGQFAPYYEKAVNDYQDLLRRQNY